MCDISVKNIIDITDAGATMPIFCNLDNGMAAVVKYPKNRFGNEVLFNELVSAEIAKSIDLPIPDFGVCNLPLDVIQEAQIEELSSENSGKCFYSKRIMNSATISAGQLLNASSFPLERLILFDYVINNRDRHVGNLLVDISNDFLIYVIDHSHVLKTRPYSSEVSSDNIPQVVLKDNYDVYKLLNRRFPISKDVIIAECERFQSIVDLNSIVSILDTIPLEWTNSIVNGRVEQSKELILERINLLPSMLELIMKEVM